MRYFLFLISCLGIFSVAEGQNLNGQWTGGFVSGGGFLSGETEYVLELEVSGTDVGGFSYTYFIINGKRCYVICKLKGSYEEGSKSLSVTEVAKIKSNTPPDFRDCLQTHILTFFKQGEKEILKGSWRSASENDRCGTGATELQRKVLVKISPAPNNNPATADNTASNTKPAEKKPATSANKTATGKTTTTPKKTTPPPATAKKNTTTTTKPATKPTTSTTKPVTKPATKPPVTNTAKTKDSVNKVASPSTLDKPRPTEEAPAIRGKIPSYGGNKFEARNKNIIKTIEVPEAEFTVHLYDNGQIDGDTVTLYFNGKLIVSKQRLSTTPISVKIKLDQDRNDNDLVMIAENLGSIPPNTALMVVTVGDKRYEVNITSTEQVNGTVRFKLRE